MRRIIVSWVVAGMLGVLLAETPAHGVAGFGDVDDGRYFTAAVQWMVDEGITTGTGPSCFSPDGLVTRGQAAAFLHRMMGEPQPADPVPFADVTSAWQIAPVAWMYESGITTGTSATTYSPSTLVTRGQVAALLHRLAGGPSAPPHAFTDVTAPWQQQAVSWMSATTITTGTSATTYSPELPISRAQMATFLHRYSGSPPVTVDPAGPTCDAGAATRRVTGTGYAPVATTGPLSLHFPADRVELVGFHQSGHDGAQQLALTPTDTANVTMSDRGRGTGSRSAMDIAVDPGDEIRAPVTGTVIRGGGYTLYCRHRDEFVVIEPDARPGWEVKVLHFEGLSVRPGDRVFAATTVIGRNATFLPFVSQIDDLTASPSWPHVHVEVIDPAIPDRPGGGC